MYFARLDGDFDGEEVGSNDRKFGGVEGALWAAL
jgi:hypothetical protein